MPYGRRTPFGEFTKAMILSKRHKFVFIKGRKVAGTSLEIFLSDLCRSEDIVAPITPIDEQHRLLNGKIAAQNYGVSNEAHDSYFEKLRRLPKEKLGKLTKPKSTYYSHMSYGEVVDAFGEIPDDWTVFAVERCPYRKVISLSNFRLNFKDYKKSGKVMSSSIPKLRKQVAKIIKDETIQKVKNIHLYKDRDGTLRPNILRYENLAEEVAALMSTLGISTYPKLPHLKKGMLSNSMDLREVFTPEQLRSINELFKDEFEAFGYEMIE